MTNTAFALWDIIIRFPIDIYASALIKTNLIEQFIVKMMVD